MSKNPYAALTNNELTELFANATPDELAKLLTEADDLYHNDGESFFTDSQYDHIRNRLTQSMPTHPYLNRVGSEVRGDKVALPSPMGGLTEIKEGELQEWLDDYQLKELIGVVSDKLDGTSALLVYGKDGHFQAAYSRGDGKEAADITRHLLKMPSVPKKLSGPAIIRAENIIKKSNFEKATQLVKRRSGENYTNLRNMVAGIMNSESKVDAVYDLIDLVGYRVIEPVMDKSVQKKWLADNGFKVGHYVKAPKLGNITEAKLADYLARRKGLSDYELDGLVVEVEDCVRAAEINKGMAQSSLDELSSIKFKVNSQFALSTVIEVEWNDSKHGIAKPTIIYESVQLGTVTASRASGVNAKFIQDNGLGPGAKIKLVRAGDVIPNLHSVITPVEPQMPVGDYVWLTNIGGDTGVDLVLRNVLASNEVLTRQMADFFEKLSIPLIRDGGITKLINADFNSIESIINADRDTLITVLGANGAKIHDSLTERLNGIQLSDLMGATVIFGRGMGQRKFKKLQDELGTEGILALTKDDEERVQRVQGFDKTARLVIENMPAFNAFFKAIGGRVTLNKESRQSTADNPSPGLPLVGQKFVFTLFRDRQLETDVIALVGEISESVSKKTQAVVTEDIHSTTGKLKKARDAGVEIVSRAAFTDRIDQLLSEADDLRMSA